MDCSLHWRHISTCYRVICAYRAYVTIRRTLGDTRCTPRHFVNKVSVRQFSAENKQESAEFYSQHLPMHSRDVIWKIKSKSTFPVSFSLVSAEMNLVGNYRTLRGLRTVNPEGLPSTKLPRDFSWVWHLTFATVSTWKQQEGQILIELRFTRLRHCSTMLRCYWPGLGSIPFFQFNSNSVIFNSNSNSTTRNKFQFQFQFQRFQFQFQFQFQFRRFQIQAISSSGNDLLMSSLKLITNKVHVYCY